MLIRRITIHTIDTWRHLYADAPN